LYVYLLPGRFPFPLFLLQPPVPPLSRLIIPVVPGGWLLDSVVAHVPDFGRHGNILIILCSSL
jgi:hypothetical protein